MRGQPVVVPVGDKIAPQRMDMVGVALGVVEFDQRDRAVQAKVDGPRSAVLPAQAKRSPSSPDSRKRLICWARNSACNGVIMPSITAIA